MVEFRLLGAVEALDDGRRLPLGSRQQRALLAILLLHVNEVMSVDRLIDEMWGAVPPPTAATTVQVYISRLRKVLGKELLATRGAGYVLQVDPDRVDFKCAERLVARARHADDPAERAGLLREALTLWRGAPFGDLAYERFAQAESERLAEERLTAIEARIEAELVLGGSTELIAELHELVAEHPLRESLRGQLMLALYRGGRQVDALAVYADARRTLVQELGLEPGSALQILERRMLNQDPTLGGAVQSPPPTIRREAETRDERKLVTVLFADIVGFTRRAEELDPEDVRALLRRFYRPIRRELERFGGTVEKYVGDAVMAVFGAPVAHEDDAERAVRAGFAVLDSVAALRGEDPLFDFDVRVGINTGRALVSLSADPTQDEGMVAGDVVNTAARLQSAAPVNGILVGAATREATEHAIEYAAIDPIHAKGKAVPVEAWQARRCLTPVGQRRPRPRRSTFVGRSAELDELNRALDDVKQGRGLRTATLVGPPGIGKTRLVSELRETAPDVRWLVGRSLSYGDGLPFFALAEIVRAEISALEGDGEAAVAAKLERAVRGRLAEEAGWVASHLRLLIGLEGEPAGGRAEAFAAWRRYLETVAEEAPLGLVLEDVHWADDGLLDFIESLRTWGRVPLLVLCTARDELLERRPAWETRRIPALTDSESAELLDDLLDLSAEERSAVVERVGGNPLFAEEFARALVDRGGETSELPRTVQGVIAARLDSLTREEKTVVQEAAVLGRVFWLDALVAVTGLDSVDVVDRLNTLEHLQFLRAEPQGEDSEYAFTHALFRDVAYEQLPRADRAERHERAAEWLESLVERAEERAELVAYHYTRAVEYTRALNAPRTELAHRAARALWRAGDRARRLFANDEAAAYIRQGLDLLEEFQVRDVELAARLHEALGDILEHEGKHEHGDAAFDRALELLSNASGVWIARLRRKQAKSRQLRGLTPSAEEAFSAATAALGETPSGDEWWEENCEVAMTRLQFLYFTAAVEVYAQHARRVEPLIATHGTGAQKSALYTWLGNLGLRRSRYRTTEETLDHMRTGLREAEPLERFDIVTWARFTYGFALLWARRLDEADVALRACLDLAERIGDATTRTRALNYLSVVERWRGRVDEARAFADQTLASAEATGMGEYVVQARATQAWVAWRDGDVDRASEIAAELSDTWDDFFLQRVFAWMPRWPLLGAALERDDLGEVAAHALVIVDPTRQPMPPDLEAILAEGIVVMGDNRPREARDEFARASEVARAYGYL